MKCQACGGSGVEYVGPFFSGPCLRCRGAGEIAFVDAGGPPPANCGDGVPAGAVGPSVPSAAAVPARPAKKPAGAPVKAGPKMKKQKKGRR